MTCACGHGTQDAIISLPVDQAEALAAVWTVLARVLAEPPTEDALMSLRSPELLQDWPLQNTGHATAGLTTGLASLAESQRRGEGAAAVADDHMRLFRGPRSAIACPYESVYRSREGLVFERETLQVRGWYSRFGLSAPRLDHDPDDQIDLELEFCATLLQRGLEAHDRGDDEESQRLFSAHSGFAQEHLLQWAPAFFDAMLKGSDTCFYRGIAELGRDALQQAAILITVEASPRG